MAVKFRDKKLGKGNYLCENKEIQRKKQRKSSLAPLI